MCIISHSYTSYTAFTFKHSIDWLIDYLLFYVTLENVSLMWRRYHCRWRAAKFRPMFGIQGLRAGRNLFRATPVVTQDLGFSGLIRMTAPFSHHLLQHERGCWEPILTRTRTPMGHSEEIQISQSNNDNWYTKVWILHN